MSTARLDKGDYPHCGELGAWFCVCVCVYTCFLCECTHAFIVCFLLMCLCTKCVCVHFSEPRCVTAFQATEMRDYLDFPSGIFSRVAEKYF